ncbi:MAG: CoA-binding protein [Candidatus Kapaibacterium sp.]
MDMKDIFNNNNTIAVYGMSANTYKAAHNVPVFMQKQGYKIIPVNPHAEVIANEKVYRRIDEIPDTIDILNVFRPSEEALEVVEYAVERHRAKGDIKLIWLQEGIVNEDAKKLAEDNGIEFIQDKCMLKEFVR